MASLRRENVQRILYEVERRDFTLKTLESSMLYIPIILYKEYRVFRDGFFESCIDKLRELDVLLTGHIFTLYETSLFGPL